MTRARASMLALAVVVVAVAVARAAPSPWQTVPGAKPDEHVVVWAAGRIWVFGNGADTSRFAVRSARVAGSRLSGWTTASLAGSGWSYEALLGQSLVFRPRTAGGAPQAVALLSNGKLGPPVELGGAPPPQSSSASPVVQLRDRAVQLVGVNGGGQFAEGYGACCDVAGKTVSYRSLIPVRSTATLGVDRHGRLWLAWATPFGSRSYAAVVQLDPATLLPQAQPAKAPRLAFAQIVDLACADVCRLVMRAVWRPRRSPNWTWAPGESTPTPIDLPGGQAARAIGVRAYGGGLTVAYTTTDAQGGLIVGLARGDTRGRNLKVRSSLPVPTSLGSRNSPANLTVGPYGSFGPTGFAAVIVLEGGSPYRAYVQTAILRL